MQNDERGCFFKHGIHTCHTFLNIRVF